MATTVSLKPNAVEISGSTSGTTTLQATAVAGTTTLTLPAATDTLVGKATTDTLTNKTLTGAAMNGTLGATTPSTASVTTLTTSSTITHNGGTANGVAYLNGSKVLTTGSALVFDGTNLGLGVTPSAWGSGVLAYQATGSSFFVGDTRNYFATNVYLNSAYATTYIGSRYALQYYQDATAGTHAWYNSASGTAGNAITFTQAMTLDSGGRLLLTDTSTPVADALFSAASSNTTAGAWSARVISRNTGNDTSVFMANWKTGSSGTNAVIAAHNAALTGWGTLYVNTTDGTQGNAGNVVIGGALLASYIYNTTGAGAGTVVVGTDGNLFRSSSSQRYKKDIVDARYGLADVLKLRAVNYVGAGDADTDKLLGGLIAEEVDAAGLSEFVIYDDQNRPDALHYAQMVSLAFKAIQEQQALIQTLTARITALESA